MSVSITMEDVPITAPTQMEVITVDVLLIMFSYLTSSTVLKVSINAKI